MTATLVRLDAINGVRVAIYSDGRCLTEVVRGQWEPMPYAPPMAYPEPVAPVPVADRPEGVWVCGACCDPNPLNASRVATNRADEMRCHRCKRPRPDTL